MNSSAIAASGLWKVYGDKTIPDGIELRTDGLIYGVRPLLFTWAEG
ncbi:hypothetical protein [Nocardia sp. Marseille-Q1738]